MKRVFNFSPGPAMLPEPVLRRAQAELLDWQRQRHVRDGGQPSRHGLHRVRRASRSATCASCSACPANYKVLFLQGGATLQFAAVPLNLAPAGSVADYVVTGNWGEKAVQEAERYVRVNVAANSQGSEVHDDSRPADVAGLETPPRICTTRRTRPCSASSSTTFPRSRTRRSSPTCRRRCCRGRST